MCKARSKVTHIKQQNMFITSKAVDIIRTVYYIHGLWGDENSFAVYVDGLAYSYNFKKTNKFKADVLEEIIKTFRY